MRNNINHNTASELLIGWYEQNKREMPWRNTKNPYKIWLSEVILQQTRVEQGLPYYLKFVQQYPTIKHLSNAKIDDVLRLWQGLGYYSRARNLHKCAKTVSNELGGFFPQEQKNLLKLPGIGPYTASAIASFAFGKKEAVVDGNVLRVVTRLFGIHNDISDQKTVRKISKIVNSMIPSDNPGIFNQAIMEFGATYCKPKKPGCQSCIFGQICESKAKGLQTQLPVKKKKVVKKTRYFQYLIIHIGNRILMKKRTKSDIWEGLFDFCLVETKVQQDFSQLKLPDQIVSNNDSWELREESRDYKHVLTHQNIFCRFFHIHFSDDFQPDTSFFDEYQSYTLDEIDQLPKPILIDKYLGGKII